MTTFTESDAIEAYRAWAQEEHHVLVPADPPIGKIFSCPVENKKSSNKAGRGKLFLNGIAAGWVQNWTDGTGAHPWCMGKSSDYSPEDWAKYQAQNRAMEAERAAEDARIAAETATLSEQIHSESADCTEHPYLTPKGVHPFGLRVTTREWRLPRRDGDDMIIPAGALVIPARDVAGKIHTLQFILDAKTKLFVPGGAKRGHFHVLGKVGDLIMLVEGYATGASIHEATGYCVVVAFDCGNLLPVGEALRAKYPKARIIIGADDDWNSKGNPGVTHATEAAPAINATVAIPEFDADRPEWATDWNDLHSLRGLATVKRQIEAVLTPPSVCVDLTQTQPEAVTYSWENYIALGESTLITAMPGVGKTLLLEEIMAAVSAGRRLPGNHFARKPAHSIFVNYEDSITKSVIPRLIAAGADPKMIHPLDFEKVALSLPDGWEIIEAEIGRYGAELCVIDPIQGFFDEKHSSNNDAQTRAVLRPGITIARKHNCAMVFIRHSNKLQGANAMAKGGGSIGFTGVARWEFMLGTSDAVDDEDTRILACVKTNFKRPPSRAFKIVDVDGIPKIEWLGEVAITADELASQGPSMRKGEKLERAVESILATLADGHWHRSEEVMANAKKEKIGERTIKAAKAQLKDDDKIENRLVGPKGEQSWWCRLLAEQTTVQPGGASITPLPPCTLAPSTSKRDASPCPQISSLFNKIEEGECKGATEQVTPSVVHSRAEDSAGEGGDEVEVEP